MSSKLNKQVIDVSLVRKALLGTSFLLISAGATFDERVLVQLGLLFLAAVGAILVQDLRAGFAKIGAAQSSREHQEISDAVVGFVDIVSSTKISNTVDLRTEWELKASFMAAAEKRAAQTGMTLLNHMGDGFLFLANHESRQNWERNLVEFHKLLTNDFATIYASLAAGETSVRSGVRFGVAQGSVMIGLLSKEPACFTAVGPDVNLAARLCAEADVNGMVVSARVWQSLAFAVEPSQARKRNHHSLKGFDAPVQAVHVARSESRLDSASMQLKWA